MITLIIDEDKNIKIYKNGKLIYEGYYFTNDNNDKLIYLVHFLEIMEALSNE